MNARTVPDADLVDSKQCFNQPSVNSIGWELAVEHKMKDVFHLCMLKRWRG